MELVRKRIEIRGVVQGVGFRPFVYRIAKRLDIRGWVLNSSDGVVIEAEGLDIEGFLHALREELPALARIDDLALMDQPPRGDENFVIEHSVSSSGRFALVPPDIATCPDCREDFTSPENRRFGYPFTNCTNCGPRYTIIRDVPCDRASTTMAEFPMCALCRAEYEEPLDRRFHAEPNACPDCGPSLGSPLERARQLLHEGRIVAIKGLGGFHLSCDAMSESAVNLLRDRKRRNGKAFAVMVPSLDIAERLCVLRSVRC